MLLSLIISCSAMQEHYGAAADPSDRSEIIFEVPKGANIRSLAPSLEKENVINNAEDFVFYVKLSKEGSCIKAGRFPLSRAMDASTIIETLCGVPLADDKSFTVVEGWRIREIDAALAKEGWAQAGEYKKLAEDPSQFTASYPLPKENLEGYLYPETYMLSPDKFTIKDFIQRQLETLDTIFAKKYATEIKDSPRSFDELIIMASMLEREEPTPKHRPMVAGILWKRLDNQWNLGVDATSRYTLDKWNDRKAFLKKLRDPKDPYNTRLRQGLPPTAIGNPSISALEASLNPEDSEFWYYLHDAQKNLHPSKNAAQHERYRKKYNVY